MSANLCEVVGRWLVPFEVIERDMVRLKTAKNRKQRKAIIRLLRAKHGTDFGLGAASPRKFATAEDK